MGNLSDYSVWSAINIISALLISLLLANILKKSFKVFQKSLIPTSVLAGIFLFIIATVYNVIAKSVLPEADYKPFFDTAFFGGNGYNFLEVVAYHTLGLGFIASTLQSTKKKMNKQRSKEIFDSGVTTVSTYLLQGIFGLGITLLGSMFFMPDLFAAAGVLLPFGYGQGTGQALNYGTIFQTQYGFNGGANFGLTVAAFGFLSASIGGVIHLMILKRKNPKLMENIKSRKTAQNVVIGDDSKDGSLGKLTVQIIFCVLAYFITYLIIFGLDNLLKIFNVNFTSVLYGFNFLFGVLVAMAIKAIINLLKKMQIVKSEVTNNYLLTNVGNFCFDIMIVAGIAAIRLDIIGNYLGILLILGVVGLFLTYFYTRLVAKTLFPNYVEEQFLATYGMLTGTASTGIVLLREIDPDFSTEAADNLVYQTLPAMVFGFPMMFLVTFAPGNELLVLGIMVAFMVVMNIILFRSKIFRKRKKPCVFVDGEDVQATSDSE